MLSKILIFIVSMIIPILLALQPIFPLVMELREITQDGESLLQEWSFVSMPAFYDSARFARSGWLESTWNNYLILGVVNHVGLVLVFFVVRGVLGKLFVEK
jgi:hypothetical protein